MAYQSGNLVTIYGDLGNVVICRPGNLVTIIKIDLTNNLANKDEISIVKRVNSPECIENKKTSCYLSLR